MTEPLATEAPPEAPGAAVEELPRSGMFAALRVPAFRTLWFGSAVVFFGVMAQSIARSWLAFDLTGSNAALGGVLLSFGVVMVLVTPFGGVVGDRWPKRLVLQWSIALLAATSLWIGLAVAFDAVAYWMLLVASALQAVAFALYNPARMAFIAELVPRPVVGDAIALMLMKAEASRVAGPALAGVVIGAYTHGTETVFLACAGLFVAGLVAGARLPPGRSTFTGVSKSPVHELLEGVRYVAGRRDLRLLLLCGIGVVMIGLPYVAFLPAMAGDVFGVGSAGYGVLSASSAAAAVVAGLLVRPLRRLIGTWRLVVASGAVFGTGVLALGLTTSFAVAVLVVVPLGAGLLVFQTTTQSLLMDLSDASFHARIQGLVMLSFGAFGIVALPLGVVADLVGLRPTLVGMAAGVLVVTTAFTLASRVHWGSRFPVPAG